MLSTAQFGLISSAAIAVCAVMALVNLLKYKSRGFAAMVMASAFVTMGVTVWMLREEYSKTYIYFGGALTAALLFVDFGLRASKQGLKR